ncbi:hypothetical protein LOTGIDRAFT_155180 [Lottia gigantea]|uniref:Uncharacterized protein n=1 Tax=Lottia gigantea TaxID=225164 RepID=V4B9P6_LOTGI|nr:hypothetical protein LOTGIDRAFT_155180 [Lottia gigantea]ESO85689.1 hypothetical protein LOTGIDRAFT_155180 [Lottia gigantea]
MTVVLMWIICVLMELFVPISCYKCDFEDNSCLWLTANSKGFLIEKAQDGRQRGFPSTDVTEGTEEVLLFLTQLQQKIARNIDGLKINTPTNADVQVTNPDSPNTPRESTIQVNKVNKAKHFLQDLPKLPSHYCRSTSKKSYLEPIFTTFSELFKVYVDDCKQENKPFLRRKAFRSLFDDMSLAIHRPKKDKCDICSGFEVGNISEEEYNLHIARKIDARNEKIRDKLRAELMAQLKSFL